MPTPRRSRRNHPYTPPSDTFRFCSSCGTRNSVRRSTCSSCTSIFGKRKPNKTVSGRAARAGAVSAVEDSDSRVVRVETSFESQETMATIPEEGSAASSPQTIESHPSQLTDSSSSLTVESLITPPIAPLVTNPNLTETPPITTPPMYSVSDAVGASITVTQAQDKLADSASQSVSVESSYDFLTLDSPSVTEPTSTEPAITAVTGSPPSQVTQPCVPPSLPDFMHILNMKQISSSTSQTQPSSVKETAMSSTGSSNRSSDSHQSMENSRLSDEPNSTEKLTDQTPGGVAEDRDPKDVRMEDEEADESSLYRRFKKDPGALLDVLKSALSMDKLTQLLSTEYHSNTEQVEQLQARLEAAYHTLKDCAKHKAELAKTIDDTTVRIKGKRKHLETIREDLKYLGEEELKLKKTRDVAYSRCTHVREKLKASRDALQQIATLTATRTESGNASQ